MKKIDNFRIVKGVEGGGKIISRYSLYEFIFTDFVVDCRQESNNKMILHYREKNTEFINLIRNKNTKVSTEDKAYTLDAFVEFRVHINKKKHYYQDCYSYRLGHTTNYFLEHIIVIDNICSFVYDDSIYILSNNISIEDGYKQEGHINELLDNITRYNNFMFYLKGGLGQEYLYNKLFEKV